MKVRVIAGGVEGAGLKSLVFPAGLSYNHSRMKKMRGQAMVEYLLVALALFLAVMGAQRMFSSALSSSFRNYGMVRGTGAP